MGSDMDSDCVLWFLALKNTKGSWVLAFILVRPFYKLAGRMTKHLETQNTSLGQIQHND